MLLWLSEGLAYVKTESATTNNESSATKSVEVSLENDRAKPENLFDYANSIKFVLADASTGNRQKLEAYANKNGCEILDMASEDLLYVDEKARDLPVADNYIRISCKINDEL